MRANRKVAFRGRKRQNKMGMFLVTLVVLMMLVVVSINSIQLREKQAEYKVRQEQLQKEIDAEHERAEEIENFKKYTQTKAYIEEVAKDKLGLVYEGEIIFNTED
ncbi:MAG: septum formation initiator family protein [Lachnospiraceae bacterium]|nr:septum formation initiator family protein [Lachnospiraceae bacterium]